LLRRHEAALLGVLTVEAVALAIGGYMFIVLGDGGGFAEKGLVATFDLGQLLIGGGAAVAGYFLWGRRAGASVFWALTGIGLIVLALDDYFMFHETAGDEYGEQLASLPLAPNNVNSIDDVVVLCYASAGVAMLILFRREVFERRESSVLLAIGAGFAALMVAVDVYAHAHALKALEFPAQTLAAGFLMLACLVRALELRRELPSRAGEVELHDDEEDDTAPEVGAGHVRRPVRSRIHSL
jgi:hypothetical protein